MNDEPVIRKGPMITSLDAEALRGVASMNDNHGLRSEHISDDGLANVDSADGRLKPTKSGWSLLTWLKRGGKLME